MQVVTPPVQQTRAGFVCHPTRLRPAAETTQLFETTADGSAVAVEFLFPFSWDAEDRGVRQLRRELAVGETLTLHAGGYGTADAVAALAGRPFDFPLVRDGHRYVTDPWPSDDDLHQDTAGWVIATVDDTALVVVWDYPGATTAALTHTEAGLQLIVSLPGDVTGGVEAPGPDVWERRLTGDLATGAQALREFLTTFIDQPDLSGMPGNPSFPTLVINSWGCGEDTSTERILGLMDGGQRLGAEVFVVDKGWERLVGDWYEGDRFTGGLRALSRAARERGMGFGIWCGFGNADRRSPVLAEHPDWATQWNGVSPVLSFDNLGLCLGHQPAAEWVRAELHRMVQDFELTWLIHDFETISRCNREDHTHPPGGGEHAAALAWVDLLTDLKRSHPQLVLENCWNGVRPLDLAMVRTHHTTITEDHCTTGWNLIAKVGLGRVLPLDWQSAYMGTENLGARARIAPYAIGGPWIVMEDLAKWDDETWQAATRAAELYRRWRGDWREGTISEAPTIGDGSIGDGVRGVEAIGTSGTRYRALQVDPGRTSLTVPTGCGRARVIDAWTGAVLAESADQVEVAVNVEGDGLLFEIVPELVP